MFTTCIKNSRRAFLGTLALGATAFTARGAFVDALTRTPTTNEGPFFPTKLPLDTDNETLCLDFAPVKDSRIGELATRWDIVLGYSPEA